jgi:uncharacterized protein YeaO (DUF488 family)
MIRIKRAYNKPEASDGARFLVDGLWPRGIKKEDLHIEGWVKGVAPSTQLRKWFGHDPAKWAEFQKRYATELDNKPESWEGLFAVAREKSVTLVFGARDPEHNNAALLKAYLDRKTKSKPRR